MQHQHIDRYIIRRVLGAGAMGSVYAAWDPKLHREVALKVVTERLSKDPKSRERFHREARAVAAARHPNIVEIYDYSGADSTHLYLVIEKLDGEDLYAALFRQGLMPEAIAAAIGHELCLALQVAHEAGIVHRDLKPENVFWNRSGRVVLTDFGIVKAVRGDSPVDGYKETTDVIGTPGFMAPELMSGQTVTPAVDIFALGALLYNITTQKLPFDGNTPLEIFQAAAQGDYEDPRKYQPNLSEEFCAVVAACLDANPKKRPRSAEMVRQALKTVLEETGVTDLRDDLHDFLAYGSAYVERAQRRSVRHVLNQLKVATQDHNSTQANRHRRRLQELDPYNDAVGDLSGVSEPTQASVGPVHGAPPPLPTEYSLGVRPGHGRGLQLGMAAALALCLISLGLTQGALRRAAQRWAPRHLPAALALLSTPASADRLKVRPIQTGADTAPNPSAVAPASAPPAPMAGPPVSPAAGPPADVNLRLVGTGGLRIDGEALPPGSNRVLQLAAGRHVLEVALRQGRPLRRALTVEAGERLNVRVDIRKREISVRDGG